MSDQAPPNDPPANDPPATDPPANDPPANDPPAATRPEGIPEELWGESGFNADAFGKYRPPAADLPAEATAYELPTIEGVEIDAADPLIEVLRTRAFEQGLGQEAFNGIITDYAAKLKAADEAAHAAAMQTIGDNAEGRIKSVSTWLDGKLPKDEAAALKALTSDGHALLGLERLMNSGANIAPRTQAPAAGERKTREQIRDLMNSKAYSGKPAERQAAVIAEVEAWFKEEERLKQAAPKA